MTTRSPTLDHENLDVYRLAIEFLALALESSIAFPAGDASFAHSSNATARGSALECDAALDVCGLLRHASPDQLDRAKHLLGRIVAMLTRMCR